jgi:hypothetical protein
VIDHKAGPVNVEAGLCFGLTVSDRLVGKRMLSRGLN